MLVLGRTQDQRIWIGDVCITVVEIRAESARDARKVRLGIEAPRSIPIHRGELVNNTPGKLVFVPAGMECVLQPISAGTTP